MSKGYKALALILLLTLLTGCGAQIAPLAPEATDATPTWEVPPPPTPTPILSPPPEAIPTRTPVTATPAPRVTGGKAPATEGQHYPPRLPENWTADEAEPAAEAAAPVTEYTVRKGDCLWTIAEALYGSGADWRRLWAANRDTVEDPSLVLIGQVLQLPETAQ